MGIADFARRLKDFFGIRAPVSDELFDDLADLLVEGDFGAAEAFGMADKLRDYAKKEKIGDAAELREALALFLEETLEQAGRAPRLELASPLPVASPSEMAQVAPAGDLGIILLLGVNGVGKTTTAAKLASRLRDGGARPILAAADTFRAAAIPQLKIHGERLGIRVVAHRQGGDPAAVIYDAIEAARAGKDDLIIADTAGRMHTKAALVEELKKIDRVVEAKAGLNTRAGRYLKYLVLDATTGRNALAQAEIFHDALALDAVILTKYDSGARGGVVFSLAEELKLPVAYICDGEQYRNIGAFDPKSFAREFTGLDKG
ncbi:MAG: signal recognition particle-docking protein FtsY [Treponema sp.]|jgi:fused signal recognition particle receptor|nr:signal recognition particle-docking protein FtsY [Treponema sp.]